MNSARPTTVVRNLNVLPVAFRSLAALLLVLALGTGLVCGNARAESKSIRTAGDVLMYVLPITGLAGTVLADDPEGRLQWAKSAATSALITDIGKSVFRKTRPSGTSRTSFPSGHTSAAFAGASFIGTRYGPIFGVPAYAAAGFVAYSRVRSDAHFADDVVAGAGIALLTNFAFVHPLNENVVVTPAIIGDGVGVRVHLNNASKTSTKRQKRRDAGFQRKFRFSLDVGQAFLVSNKVTAPQNGGTTFELNNFQKNDDPTTTASAVLDWFVDDRQQLTLEFTPFESRDEGRFSAPVRFGESTFPADTPIQSAWRIYQIRARYNYTVLPADPWLFQLGAGLHVQRTEIELKTGALEQSASNTVALPLLHAKGGYAFADKYLAWVEVEGTVVPDHDLFEVGVGLTYKMSPRWDATLSYRYAGRNINTGSLNNRYRYQGAFLNIGYSF